MPLYFHHCKDCNFLGSFDDIDYYFCQHHSYLHDVCKKNFEKFNLVVRFKEACTFVSLINYNYKTIISEDFLKTYFVCAKLALKNNMTNKCVVDHFINNYNEFLEIYSVNHV